MTYTAPYRSAFNPIPPSSDDHVSSDRLKNLAGMTAGAAAGIGIAGISGLALKAGLLAGAGAVSLAMLSPAAITAAGVLVATDVSTGLPLTQAFAAAAAFVVARWATKTLISTGQAAVQAFQTGKELVTRSLGGLWNRGGSTRPIIATPRIQPGIQYRAA